ncbi:MAG: reductive dehalogenase domain-containing protein [Candidatus Promineifilaceae bacterium]
MFKEMFNLIVRRGGREQARPSLDAILEQTDQHIHNLDTLVRPAPTAKPRTPFNTNLPKEKISMLNFTVRQRLRVITKAVPLIVNMQRGARLYDKRFPAQTDQATPEFIAALEARARQLGAKDIAYVKVPANAIFQGKGIPCQYAILFTVEMDKEPINTAPSFECQLEVMDGYKRMSTIAGNLAQFMRRNGFEAYPGTALGGLTDYVYLAELAGLGAIGYHGLLISPNEGARLRINTIYTNITNLPTLETQGKENEHLWVRDFCAMCKKCIRECPVEAIFEEPRPRGDGGMQTIEHATCRDYFTEHYGCAVCLAVCPFSRAGYDKVQARFKGNAAAPQFRIPVAAVQATGI